MKNSYNLIMCVCVLIASKLMAQKINDMTYSFY